MLGVTNSEATGLLVAKAFSKKEKEEFTRRKWGAKAAELVKISLLLRLEWRLFLC